MMFYWRKSAAFQRVFYVFDSKILQLLSLVIYVWIILYCYQGTLCFVFQQEAEELADSFNATASKIQIKAMEAEMARNRSRSLLEMATKFKERAQEQYEELQGNRTQLKHLMIQNLH